MCLNLRKNCCFLGVPRGPYRDTRRRRALCLSPRGQYSEAFAYHLRRRRRRALWLWGGCWLAAWGLIQNKQKTKNNMPSRTGPCEKRIGVAQATSLPFLGNCVSRCASPSRPWSSPRIARRGTPSLGKFDNQYFQSFTDGLSRISNSPITTVSFQKRPTVVFFFFRLSFLTAVEHPRIEIRRPGFEG